jgi:hypothetical protein
MIGIFSSTVKKNIIFGKEYDGELFRRVIHAAALEAVCLYSGLRKYEYKMYSAFSCSQTHVFRADHVLVQKP